MTIGVMSIVCVALAGQLAAGDTVNASPGRLKKLIELDPNAKKRVEKDDDAFKSLRDNEEFKRLTK